jgi:uncharacterized protein DUF559
LCLYFAVAKQNHREQVGAVASRQAGRIAYLQLTCLDVAPATVHRWEKQGYLERLLPGVYAVGHSAPSREAGLWSAVLYAGPGAMLSHGTDAHWRGLIDYAPRAIQVSTPRQVRPLPGIRVYGRRSGLVREVHKGIPVTSIPEMMVDLAATSGPRIVNRALGQLDFRKLLDVNSLLQACGSGQRGSTRLREAIDAYEPRRKYANGHLEEDFLDLCERLGLPLPLLNMYVHDIKVDAYWPAQRLVVELDSELNHSSPGQRRRDRRNDLELRAHGLTVLRYDSELVHERAAEVHADIVASLKRLTA